MSSNKRTIFLPIVIILCAIGIATLLINSRAAPQATPIEHQPPLIDAIEVVKQDLKISVKAQGTVTARTSTTIVAQVPGLIIDVSGKFKAGGFFKRGELLAQIDQRDYQAKVQRAKAAVASAKSQLATEQGRAEVAYQDWLKYKSKVKRSQAATDLALRKPQLADAKARLDAAMADLQQAQLDLERTSIRAPYDGLVQEKHVDIGQYVNTGSTLGKTFAIDVAELRLALPQSQLQYVDLPGLTDHHSTTGPAVDLHAHIGDQLHHWPAQLVRTEGVFDPRSRVLFAVAQIHDPYGLETARSPVLRLGTFVQADIEGKLIAGLVKLPRHILRAGNRVWVIDSEQRLQDRQVNVLRTQGEHVYVTAGLDAGELVSLSTITSSVTGTVIRVASTILSSELDATSGLAIPTSEHSSKSSSTSEPEPELDNSSAFEQEKGQTA